MRIILATVFVLASTPTFAGQWPDASTVGAFRPCILTLITAPHSNQAELCMTQAAEAAAFNGAYSCDEASRPRFAKKLASIKWPDDTPLFVAAQATAALGGCRR